MNKLTLSGNSFTKIFALIKLSLNGTAQDYTNGSIRRAVILLAIPMMLEMCMESVFAVVDIFFVSHLGKHATSVVGLTESLITIVYALAVGISMAATALVARRIGEKNKEAASRAGMQAMILAILITIAISIPGVLYPAHLLAWMGAEPAAIADGIIYTRITMASSLVIMLLFLLNGIFRGAGDAMMAMKSLWLANICNIILCPLLIRGWGPLPAFGIAGAAIATTIGRSIGVSYQLYQLFNGKKLLQCTINHLLPDLKLMKAVFSIAWPATLQFLIGSGSWIVLASLIAHTGHSEASAGYQIALRLVMFFLLPAWGLANAAATLVGQNMGAKQLLRAEQSVLKTAKYNAIFMFLVSSVILIFAPGIVHFFTTDAIVAGHAVAAARIVTSGFVFYGIGMVMASAFNGAGDTKTPTIVNFFGFWCFQIPLAYLLSITFEMGPTGVFIAIPVAETAITIAVYLLFKKGKWKLKEV